MKKSVALTTLAATIVWVTSVHIEWVAHDNGHLMVIDGQSFDVMGELSEYWNRTTRQCHQVRRVFPEEYIHAQVLAVIKDYSPPQSRMAHVVSLWTAGDWLLAEVEFKELFPAVVLIKQSVPSLTVVPHGVWSGVTKPWKAIPKIRHYLSAQVPEAPVDLLRCFELQSVAF